MKILSLIIPAGLPTTIVDPAGNPLPSGIYNPALQWPERYGLVSGGDHGRSPVADEMLVSTASAAMLWAAEQTPPLAPPVGAWTWTDGDNSDRIDLWAVYDAAFTSDLGTWLTATQAKMKAAGWDLPGAPPKRAPSAPLETSYRTRWWTDPKYSGLTVRQALEIFAPRLKEIASAPGYSESDAMAGADFMTIPSTWVLAHQDALAAIEGPDAPPAGQVSLAVPP